MNNILAGIGDVKNLKIYLASLSLYKVIWFINEKSLFQELKTYLNERNDKTDPKEFVLLNRCVTLFQFFKQLHY
jgi:hypothetical protein